MKLFGIVLSSYRKSIKSVIHTYVSKIIGGFPIEIESQMNLLFTHTTHTAHTTHTTHTQHTQHTHKTHNAHNTHQQQHLIKSEDLRYIYFLSVLELKFQKQNG